VTLNAIDMHHVENLQNTAAGAPANQALMQHALAPGWGESTTAAQVRKALAYWEAREREFAQRGYGDVVADAISYLRKRLAHVLSPHTVEPPFDQ